MKVQIVLFKDSDTFIARAIKWQTWSDYCHAALLFNSNYLIESVGGKGVIDRYVTAADLENSDIFDVVGIDEEHKSVVFEFASSCIGKKYDYLGCVRFATRTKPLLDDRYFCSELVAAAFIKAEYPLLLKPASKVDPGDLATSPLVRLSLSL